MKIVLNSCYGGFGLSDEAIKMYLNLSISDSQSKWFGWTIVESTSIWGAIYWELYSGLTKKSFYDGDINRTDPTLIKVVETLGEKANGDCAELCIEDIPSGTLYKIDEYDGIESIIYKESDEWLVAI